MLKLFTLIVLASAEDVNSFPRVPETVTTLELWNPYTWWFPFGIAQAESWSNYLKQAQRVSNGLYRLIQRYIQTGLFNRQILNGNKVKEQGTQKQNRTTAMMRVVEDVAPAFGESTGEDTPGVQGERATAGEISGADHWK